MKPAAAFIAIALAVAAVSAQASTYRFSYASGIGSFAGRIDGTLQADGNTILIDAVSDFIRLDGVALPSLPLLTTGSTLYGTPRAAAVTLNGSWLDFLACDEEYCSANGFGFDPDTIEFTPSLITSVPVAGYDFGYREAVAVTGWSISAVPEPGAWAMLVMGFAMVGAAARRRNTAVAA